MFFVNLLRRLFIFLGFIVTQIATRVKVTGLENIPQDGPAIIAPNHASNFDPLYITPYVPFKKGQILTHDAMIYGFPFNMVIKAMRPLTVKQSEGMGGLKMVREFLANRGILCVFPEGGMWEKRLDDVKLGAAYLAASTNAKVIPVALGGTYRLWRKIIRLQRPRVSIHFGQAVDPAQYFDRSTSRRIPREKLQEFSAAITHEIYKNLPEADQKRYYAMENQTYHAKVEFTPADIMPTNLDFPVLSEIINKPNLFKPIGKKPEAAPFSKKLGQFVPASTFHVAIMSMQQTIHETLEKYLEERIGAEKTQALDTELNQLAEIATKAISANASVSFTTYTTETTPSKDNTYETA
jgi:1-acyl-sn-glycerol-3-phosphate acyltransferase